MNFPERCPICHNKELKKSSRYYPDDGIIYWIHCDTEMINNILWHFSVLINRDEIDQITYCIDDLNLHFVVSLKNSKAVLSRIESGPNVTAIHRFPQAPKFDYYDHDAILQKMRIMATYL